MRERDFEKSKPRGIEQYRAALAEGTSEVVEREGKKFLRIYRGLEVPEQQTYSEGEHLRTSDQINITNPGIDWTPIYSYAKVYASPDFSKRWCILSALAPLDNQKILAATIDDQKMLTSDEWGAYDERQVHQISDSLMVVVPPDCYQELKEVTIQECFGDFSKS